MHQRNPLSQGNFSSEAVYNSIYTVMALFGNILESNQEFSTLNLKEKCEWYKIIHFINTLETTQAMLWFSCKSIIQKNGNIGIFQWALKLWEITASFISLHWKHWITPIHFRLLPLHGAMNPAMIDAQIPLFLPRCQLSGLIQQF